MSDKISYDDLLHLFEVTELVNETVIYFDDDPEEYDHYLGYIPKFKGAVNDKPYWIGLCDIDGGCEFKTAKELFEAKVFDGKSIKERWSHVIVWEIGGMCVEDFMTYCDSAKFLSDKHKFDEQ
ncbi:MAG: hypothetical protein SR1Q7_07085 [Quinella sp. 1Q7]|nr:hypothetical protein [Quinella sp. 1Q7]